MTNIPRVVLRHPVNALISFHYFANEDVAETQALGLRLIGDSGAFSAMSLGKPVSLASFSLWANKWTEHLAWVASLDAIGDPVTSWKNYKDLRLDGLSVVPTIHYGEEPQALDRYAEEGVDFIGLGGLVRVKAQPDRILRWCLRIFRYAREKHPAMKFHGWGVTQSRPLNALPWFSVDSTGFRASRYGKLKLFVPERGRIRSVFLDGKDLHKDAGTLARHYGVPVAPYAYLDSENRGAVERLGTKSAQVYEDYLRQRHGVITPPMYGMNSALPGPHIHVALNSQSHAAWLTD